MFAHASLIIMLELPLIPQDTSYRCLETSTIVKLKSRFFMYLNLKWTGRSPNIPNRLNFFRGALSNFTRIEHDSWSHFNLGHNHLNDIDFIYVSSPGWAQLPWSMICNVGSPEDFHAKGLSDYAVVSCCLSIAPNEDYDYPSLDC